MIRENLVMRNLGILERLTQGEVSLGELAKFVKFREGELSSSLNLLVEQGLIAQYGNNYVLADAESVGGILEIVIPWKSYFDGKFLDIARDTARIIHEKAYDSGSIAGVMLYGSTLTSDSPRDIDLLILHRGSLECFSPYATLRVDEPVGDENARDSAYKIFMQLGYKEEGREADSVCTGIERRIEELNAGSMVEETRDWFSRADTYGVNNVFDVNVLYDGLLEGGQSGADKDSLRAQSRDRLREGAIASCRDPTFWYTILSEGRIYDREKHDFSIKVEDNYPGALSLFPLE